MPRKVKLETENLFFSNTPEDLKKLLYMPEAMIIYRFHFKGIGLTEEWWNKFISLSEEKMQTLKPLIHTNNFRNIESLTSDSELLDVLFYYTITREDAENELK